MRTYTRTHSAVYIPQLTHTRVSNATMAPSTRRDSILRSNAFLGPFEISTPVRPLGVRRSYSAALRSDPEWAPVWGWMFAS